VIIVHQDPPDTPSQTAERRRHLSSKVTRARKEALPRRIGLES
jgi:hypothetical protein